MKSRQKKIKSLVFSKLLKFSGQTIDESKLIQYLRGKIKRSDAWEIDLSEILNDLSQLQLINIKKNKISFQKDFLIDGKVSIGPRGNAFISCALEKEVFLRREESFYLHNGQQVTVKLIDYFRRRFSAQLVVSEYIEKTFLCQSIHKTSAGTLGVIFTQTDKQQIFIRGDQVEPGSYFNAVQADQVAVHKNSLPQFIKFIEHDFVKVLEFESYYDLKSEKHILDRIKNQFNLPPEYELSDSKKKELKKRFKDGIKQENRIDLENLYSFTIDGESAKDFDDAISFEKSTEGFNLYVHIADVSFFVNQGSELDKEACKRGNSTYLHPAVLPMLPNILSEDLCSLVPKKTRLAVTAKLEYDSTFQVINTSFFRSKIKVNKRYTYEIANKILTKPDSELSDIAAFCKSLGAKRNKNGRIRLENTTLDNFSSEQLIEECMLSANVEVAKHFRKNNKTTILRVHPPISTDQLEKLNSILTLYDLPQLNSEDLALGLQSVIKKAYEKYPEIPFTYLILRTFSIASYKVERKGHWGLAFEDYLHFTSPIRRYADLQVHRQLFNNPPVIIDLETLESVCKVINETERVSMQAERELQRIRGALELTSSINSSFSAVISGLSSQKIFVLLNDNNMEGLIEPMAMNCQEFIPLNEYQLTVPGSNKVLTLGQPISVTLKKVEPIQGRLYFTL
jgi:ribonuclease R